MMSLASLVASGFRPTQARAFAGPLAAVFALNDISTPSRQAAFVGQAGIESSMFAALEEDLHYRDPVRLARIFPDEIKTQAQALTLVGNPQGLANTVYANKNGNGDFASGDGWTFRGRGFGITGRANYTRLATACARPYVEQPDLVSTPSDACLSFGQYWMDAKCNALADTWDIDKITRAINGPGMQAAKDRRDLSVRCLRSFR